MASWTRPELDALKARNGFLHIVTEFQAADGRSFRHVNDFFFEKYKALSLPRASVKAEISPAEEGFDVDLTTDAPAFFVMLQTPGIRGRFSDNSFTLLPGTVQRLHFTPEGTGCSADELRRSLIIEHLRTTYR